MEDKYFRKGVFMAAAQPCIHLFPNVSHRLWASGPDDHAGP